jgi:hypothetical protein
VGYQPYLYQYGLEIGIKSESLLEGTELTIEDIDDVDLYINWEISGTWLLMLVSTVPRIGVSVWKKN